MAEPIDDTQEGMESESSGLTRRQVLIAATAGGATLAVAALGGAAAGSLATRADSLKTQAQYELELSKLRTLVGLYEGLERVGIDAVIQTGVNLVRSALETVRNASRLIRDGITAAEKALATFQQTLQALRPQVERAALGLGDLMNKFHAAEAVVISVLGTALPLTESIRGFFNALLDKIPFGIADNIKRSVDALVSLVQAIPATVENVSAGVLSPVTENFFPAGSASPVKATVVDSITANLLAPLGKFLDDVEKLANTWDRDLAAPVQSALSERQKIRDQIASYRKENRV